MPPHNAGTGGANTRGKEAAVPTRRMEREVRDLFLGYALVNFLEPGPVEFHWGKYNNRAIDKSMSNRSWTTSGLRTSLDDHSAIKTIVWTASTHLGRVEVLGGRHRTQALNEYAAILKKKLAAETTKLEKAEAKAKGRSSDKLDQLRAVVGQLEEDVRTTGFMVAALYKRANTWRILVDERDQAVARHDGGRTPFGWASQAALRAQETGVTGGPRSPGWSEEVVQQLWTPDERKKNHRQIRILSSPFLYPFIQAIKPFPALCDGNSVNIKYFNDLLTPATAGFGQFWVQAIVTKAREISRLQADTVKRYMGWLQYRRHEYLERRDKLQPGVPNPGRQVPPNRLRGMLGDYYELFDEFAAAHHAEDIWPVALFDEIDDIYKDVIRNRWHLLGGVTQDDTNTQTKTDDDDDDDDDDEEEEEDPQQRQVRAARRAKRQERLKKLQEQERLANPRTWDEAIQAYYVRVDDAVKKQWARARQRTNEPAHKKISDCLQQIDARWMWMKNVWLSDPYGAPLPLPTSSLIADLFAHLSEVREAVKFMVHDRQTGHVH
ncbi:hypothetical protein C8Q70DRAFT_937902 [Cubamyces menziesii]|nr:hypothetical protein C8Q70DRAFT_937902 [Cubamyces menziesii]